MERKKENRYKDLYTMDCQEDINIFSLNTALTAIEDKEKGIKDDGNVYLDIDMFNKQLEKVNNDNPIIMLGHHSLYSLNQYQRNYIKQRLEDRTYNIAAYICGHMHLQTFERIDYLNEFVAGTLALDRNANHNLNIGFYYGEIEPKMGEGAVYAYRGDLVSFRWAPHNTYNVEEVPGMENRKRFNFLPVIKEGKHSKRVAEIDLSFPTKIRQFDENEYSDLPEHDISEIGGFYKWVCQSRDNMHYKIVSGAGYGKTTVLLKMFDIYINQSNKMHRTLYIPLKDCEGDLLDYIYYTYDINEKHLLKDRENKIIFLLDGLNEVSIENSTKILNQIKKIGKNSKNTCVITSRTNEKLLLEESNFKLLKLDKLEENFVRKFLDENEISYSDDIIKVIDTPLMLKLFTLSNNRIYNCSGTVLKRLEIRGLKRKLCTCGEIYWNFYKSQYIKIGDDRQDKIRYLEELLPDLAEYLSTKQILADNLSNIKRYYKSKYIWDEKQLETAIIDFLGEELGLISHKEKHGDKIISFSHESYQDFFAALHLYNVHINAIQNNLILPAPKKNPINRVRKFYIELIDDSYLNDVINNFNNTNNSRAIAYAMLGDLYVYKRIYSFNSQRTNNIKSTQTLLDKAVKYYRSSANLGNEYGLWSLGAVCRDLYKREKDLTKKKEYGKEAFTATKESLNMNYPYSFNQMGVLYLEGIGVDINIEKAKYYFKKGIEYKVAHSYNRLALLEEKEAERLYKPNESEEAIKHYISAFCTFFEQVLYLNEEYGMNRLTYYYYDGICNNEWKFNLDWLPEEKEYKVIKADPDKFMYDILTKSAFAGNKYAIERKKRIDK